MLIMNFILFSILNMILICFMLKKVYDLVVSYDLEMSLNSVFLIIIVVVTLSLSFTSLIFYLIFTIASVLVMPMPSYFYFLDFLSLFSHSEFNTLSFVPLNYCPCNSQNFVFLNFNLTCTCFLNSAYLFPSNSLYPFFFMPINPYFYFL